MSPNKDLEDAVIDGDIIKLDRSVQAGANVNALISGIPPLSVAISNGEEAVALRLVELGADVSFQPIPGDTESVDLRRGKLPTKNEGSWMLVLSCGSCLYECVVQLLQCYFFFTLIHILRPSLFDLRQRGAYAEFILYLIEPLILFPPIIQSFALSICFCGKSMERKVWMIACAYLTYICLSPSMPFELSFHEEEHSFTDLSDALFFLWDMAYLRSLLTYYPFLIFAIIYSILYAVFVGIIKFIMPENGGGSSGQSSAAIAVFGGSDALSAVCRSYFDNQQICSILLTKAGFIGDYIEKCSLLPDSEILQVLEWSIRTGDDKIFTQLLDMGLDPVKAIVDGCSTLEAVGFYGRENFIKLIDTAVQNKTTAFYDQINKALSTTASGFNRVEVYYKRKEWYKRQEQTFETIFEKATNVNATCEIGRTALSHLVEAERVDLVEKILERDVDVNLSDDKGKTPIFYLRDGENTVKLCDMLVKAGANIDHADKDGNTVLLEGINQRYVKAARAILKAGADPRIADKNGITALHWAARGTRIEMMQDLIGAGADVDAVSNDLETPLLFILRYSYGGEAALRLLLEHGADPMSVNGSGESAIDIIKKHWSRCEGGSARVLLEYINRRKKLQ